MKLVDALEINRVAGFRKGALTFHATVACGFTPLQIGQFLAANLHRRLPEKIVDLSEVDYGDVVAGLDQFDQDTDQIFLILEWQDLDPRLGLRRANWKPSLAQDILSTAETRLNRIAARLEELSLSIPVTVSLPRLRIPLFTPSRFGSLDPFESEVEGFITKFSKKILSYSRSQVLQRSWPPATDGSIHAPASDLRFDIPYSQGFLSDLAKAMVAVAFPPPALKGLITDLDETLWKNKIGEVGADKVTWDIPHQSHIHAVYQQALEALSEMGVLLAIASKNELDIANAGLDRTDLRVGSDTFFPKEIHWNPKSESVSRILETWNIGADSVLFVDDSEAEIAEVIRAHPDIQTAHFSREKIGATLDLIHGLKERFTPQVISETGKLRAASIRQKAETKINEAQLDPEVFLEGIDSRVNLTISNEDDPRAFELINKTNQFNLNGIRISEKDWVRLRNQDGVIVMKIDYADKFGALGRIGVLMGNIHGNMMDVTNWVLSCRAFSRRIEFLCLRELFLQLAIDTLRFAFEETARNRPMKKFITSLMSEGLCQGETLLGKKQFLEQCPQLYHDTQFRDERSDERTLG